MSGHGPVASSEGGRKKPFIRRVVEEGVEGLDHLAHESGLGAVSEMPGIIPDFFGAGGGHTKSHSSHGHEVH